MATTKRRYSKEEFAQRGDAVYEAVVRPQLTSADDGRFAAIDLLSSTYEVDVNEIEPCDRLRARVPDAQI